MDTLRVLTSDFVNVVISNSNSDSTLGLERRFRKDITIGELKGKLEMLTGGCPATMKVDLYSREDTLMGSLDKDDALLGSYPIDDGMRIHVVDKFLLRSAMTDTSDVEKYEMSKEDYASRSDTVRSFLARNRLGKFNEEEMQKKEEERLREEAEEETAAKAISVGNRCQVGIPDAPLRRGVVKYVGLTDFKKGWWVGVHYDEPMGKNDGSANGKRYFECPPKYGGFVKPMYIEVGDFPEEEFDIDEM